MNRPILAALALLCATPAAMAGERFAINPWLSDEFSPADVTLEGTWRYQGTTPCVRFVPLPAALSFYDVYISDCVGSGEAMYTVSAHNVDGRLLFVVRPAPAHDDMPLLVPVHWLIKVELDGDTMQLFNVDDKSFDWRAESSGIPVHDNLVLAETDQLETFVGWQTGDYGFFKSEPEFMLKKLEEE